MDSILGALAFAGLTAAQVLAVVAVHSERGTSGKPSPPESYDVPGRWKLSAAVVAVVCLLVLAGAHEASGAESAKPGRGTAACAERYVKVLTLIEDLGDAPNFAGDRLFKAVLATMHARETCSGGQENDALLLYDRVVLDLVFPVASLR